MGPREVQYGEQDQSPSGCLTWGVQESPPTSGPRARGLAWGPALCDLGWAVPAHSSYPSRPRMPAARTGCRQAGTAPASLRPGGEGTGHVGVTRLHSHTSPRPSPGSTQNPQPGCSLASDKPSKTRPHPFPTNEDGRPRAGPLCIQLCTVFQRGNLGPGCHLCLLQPNATWGPGADLAPVPS